MPASERPTSVERTRYRRWRVAMAVGVLAYVAAAVGQELRPGKREIFPLSAYVLFTWVPNHTQDYSLRLIRFDDRPLASPVWFESGYRGYWAQGDATLRMLIQKYGLATDAADAREAGRLAGMIVRRAGLDRTPMRFQLVRRQYDPLARAQGSAACDESVIATLETTAS